MNNTCSVCKIMLFGWLMSASAGEAAIHYVNVNSTNPVAPYTTWATAANVVQDGIDVALPGDEVIVTNGVYSTGGHIVFGAIPRRVAVTNAISVLSVNGPDVTIIEGAPAPEGSPAVAGVYLADRAMLAGFTVTNGATEIHEGPPPIGRDPSYNGGGIWCAQSGKVSNCVIVGNSASFGGGVSGGIVICSRIIRNRSSHQGGGAYYATIEDSIVTDNSAGNGGGTFGGTLSRCEVSLNSARDSGGGVLFGTVRDCVISSNSADFFGGGALEETVLRCRIVKNAARLFGGGSYASTIDNSVIAENAAAYGGGACNGVLTGCTLSNNLALFNGGGAYTTPTGIVFLGTCVLSNCVLIQNSAGDYGGGAYGGTAINSVLSENSARWGGGAYAGTLNNCTLFRNIATEQGGGFWSLTWPPPGCPPLALCDESGCGPGPGTLNNCIVVHNTAPDGSNYFGGTVNYSCTTPPPANGVGTIASAPLFIDAATGNYRLQSNSPCINAGRNMYAPVGSDLDGNARTVGGTVDIGAYEFQSPQSTLSYAWLQQYGLPTDGSADFADADGDTMNNWQEWRAWTDPTSSASALRSLTPLVSKNALLVRWQSVSGQTYFLERSTNLGLTPTFLPLASNVIGQTGATIYADTNVVSAARLFYRVRIQE